MSTENNTSNDNTSKNNDGNGISEETLLKYARAFVAGPGAKAIAAMGFNQQIAGHLAAYILVQEGFVDEENRKDVAKLLNSHGIGTNASQLRQKLEKKGVVSAKAAVTDELFD